jgi:hypothetical protein
MQVPSSMLTPNLHVVTYRLMHQELARGPAANENEYYMERYMLEPKRRNAHRTTAQPEVTHLRHVEMPRRALSRSAVQYGCKSLQELVPASSARHVVHKHLYDCKIVPPFFPNKGSELAITDSVRTVFLAFIRQHSPANSFWADFALHQQDPVNPDPLPQGSKLMFLRFQKAVLPGFKVKACEHIEKCSHARLASACVELELPQRENRQGQEVTVLKPMVGQILWCGMVATWDAMANVLKNMDRFAYAYVPPSQAHVSMGGVKAFTAVLTAGPHGRQAHSLPVPLEFVQGPFIMLKPNPGNTQGHAETYRFFATPKKHGLL